MNYRELRILGGKGSGPGRFRDGLRGLAVDRQDRLHVVADEAVTVFDGDGEPLRRWATARPGWSVAVRGDGKVFVGEKGQVEIFDAEGRSIDTWNDAGGLGLITAIGFGRSGDVFLADANARCIRRYDEWGVYLNAIGDQHRKGGFHIPNGVVDFAIDGDGQIHAANPGMHRVETFSPDGVELSHFGRFDGQDPKGFPGCCNPTNVALDRDGRVFVTEKAGPRAKVYDAGGRLLVVIADDVFDPLAKNMDLAVDSRGVLYVADTARLEIRVFAPVTNEAAEEVAA